MASTTPAADLVIAAIERHFRTHANAADTADGIRRFWLTGPMAQVSLATVEAALEEMVRTGRASRIQNLSGQAVYMAPRR
ncbi:MAG: hypothetical protein U1F54_00140 [Burkholderiales bacterium]